VLHVILIGGLPVLPVVVAKVDVPMVVQHLRVA
jgi:hypothetical protein